MIEAIGIIWCLKIATSLLLTYRRLLRPSASPEPPHYSISSFPSVCIQIPVFNEPEYVRRIILSAGTLDWPDESLELQVLDDSLDETPELAAQALKELRIQRPGLATKHLRRKERIHFKAGALNHGFSNSNADFFAVFDCDFKPGADFLKRALPYFEEPSIACVQVPWSFMNGDQNILTKVQSLLLRVHFHIEHAGRFLRGLVFNFNGTAGVWRASSLRRLGGFSGDSVAEDLLLSLKTYMSGERIALCTESHCPSVLPDNLSAYLVQQRRWALGTGQCLRSSFSPLLRSDCLSWRAKFDAVLHLAGFGICSLLLLCLLAVPWLIWLDPDFLTQDVTMDMWALLDILLTLVFFASLFFLFGSKYVQCEEGMLKRFGNVGLVIGMAPMYVLMVAPWFWRGLFLGGAGPRERVFHRTPKGRFKRRLRIGDWLLGSGFVAWCFVCAGLALEVGLGFICVVLLAQGFAAGCFLPIFSRKEDSGGSSAYAYRLGV